MTYESAADWQVYIVRCNDDTLYTGVARDLQHRLDTHNNGRGAKYTRSRLPVELAYTERAATRSAAQQREAAIKRLSRTDKLLLIEKQSG